MRCDDHTLQLSAVRALSMKMTLPAHYSQALAYLAGMFERSPADIEAFIMEASRGDINQAFAQARKPEGCNICAETGDPDDQ